MIILTHCGDAEFLKQNQIKESGAAFSTGSFFHTGQSSRETDIWDGIIQKQRGFGDFLVNVASKFEQT